MRCHYMVEWRGRCQNDAVENGLCEQHADKRCISCGAIATHGCAHTAQFVCGYPLCPNCEHREGPDFTGAWVSMGHGPKSVQP